MLIGLSSYTYGWNVGTSGATPRSPWTEIDLVKRTVESGLTCLQIGDNIPLLSRTVDEREAFRKMIAGNKIRLEIGARELTPIILREYLEFCSYYNAPLLRFVIDGADYEPTPDTIIHILRDFVSELRKRGIILGIENHDRLKAKQLARIIETVGDDHVGICLDCANSLGAGEGLEYVTHILAPYTVNLHVKDFNITRLSHKMGFIVTGAPAGKGMLDLPWLINQVEPYNRCQSAIIEQWVIPDDNLTDTCTKEELWAKESLRYVKSLLTPHHLKIS
jgi:3-oxoisoapionate decarboxylase